MARTRTSPPEALNASRKAGREPASRLESGGCPAGTLRGANFIHENARTHRTNTAATTPRTIFSDLDFTFILGCFHRSQLNEQPTPTMDSWIARRSDCRSPVDRPSDERAASGNLGLTTWPGPSTTTRRVVPSSLARIIVTGMFHWGGRLSWQVDRPRTGRAGPQRGPRRKARKPVHHRRAAQGRASPATRKPCRKEPPPRAAREAAHGDGRKREFKGAGGSDRRGHRVESPLR